MACELRMPECERFVFNGIFINNNNKKELVKFAQIQRAQPLKKQSQN